MAEGGNFVSDTHALRAGFLFGLLLKSGITFEPQFDDENNYTDELVIVLPPLSEYEIPIRVRIKVLPPPEGEVDDQH